MAKIVKNSGRKEAFDAKKVKASIRKAAADAGLTEARTRKVVAAVYKDVSSAFRKEDEVDSSDLRACILADLDSIAPSVSKAWRKFDRRYKC